MWKLLVLANLAFSIQIQSPKTKLKIRPRVSSFIRPFKLSSGNSTLSITISCVSYSAIQVFRDQKPVCGETFKDSIPNLNKILKQLYTLLDFDSNFLEIRYHIFDERSKESLSFTQTIRTLRSLKFKQTNQTIIFKNLHLKENIGFLKLKNDDETYELEVVSTGDWPPELHAFFVSGQLSIALKKKVNKDTPTTIFFYIRDGPSGIVSGSFEAKLLIPIELYDEPVFLIVIVIGFLGFVLAGLIAFGVYTNQDTKSINSVENIATPQTLKVQNPIEPERILTSSIMKWDKSVSNTKASKFGNHIHDFDVDLPPKEIRLSGDIQNKIDLSVISHTKELEDDEDHKEFLNKEFDGNEKRKNEK